MLGILGNKVGMTQIFTENGDANAVTVIKVGPCIITQIKSVETHGYNSIQIGYKEVSKTKLTKPELGHLEKSNILPLKYLKEYEVPNISDFELGQVINGLEIFNEVKFVDTTSKTIGKGFAGNQKRHNFSRGPMTHGSKNHREPGSIGQGSTPARVFPGKKMYGKLGDKQTTVSNLQILKIDTEENLLL